MYRIAVIDNDSEHTLDMKKSSFPFNFESNDIAQLNDSTASWSYTITLPRTPNNDRILGFAGIPFVNSTTPYERKRCNVYMDGLRIIHNGVLIIDSTTKTEYKVQVLAGNADVFELMKAVDFKTWHKTTVTLPTTSLPSATTPGAGVVYAYPQSLIISSTRNTRMNAKSGDFYWYETPLLKVGSPTNAGTLKSLLTEIGFSLVTDVPDATLDALWLSMATRKKDNSGQSGYIWRSGEQRTGIDNVITNDGKTPYGHSRITARCPITARYDSHYSRISSASCFSNFVSAGGTVNIYIYDQTYIAGQANDPIAIIRTSDFQVSGDEIIASIDLDDSVSHLEFKTFGGDSNTTWRYYDGSAFKEFTGLCSSNNWRVQTIPDDTGDNAYSGMNMNLEANCGIANGMDFFKILSQVFGWTIKIDQDTKTIYAYSFGYITGRKSYAPDWTLKVAQDLDREVDFEFGKYAQENIIQYAENKLGGYRQSTSFAIPNVNLAAKATLLDIKVSSGNAERVEQWEVKDDGSLQWKDTGTPHLIIWAAAADTPAHYTLAQVLANYQSLIAAIQATQTISLKMYLTAVDILNFDQFTPIYLKQFGQYFYVNKIKDWEVGKLCTVELLRI